MKHLVTVTGMSFHLKISLKVDLKYKHRVSNKFLSSAKKKIQSWDNSERLEWVFKLIDKNNSHSIQVTELLELFATLYILEGQDKDKALGIIYCLSVS